MATMMGPLRSTLFWRLHPTMPPQFVFEMRDVTKAFGEKVVLRDISLSFF